MNAVCASLCGRRISDWVWMWVWNGFGEKGGWDDVGKGGLPLDLPLADGTGVGVFRRGRFGGGFNEGGGQVGEVVDGVYFIKISTSLTLAALIL